MLERFRLPEMRPEGFNRLTVIQALLDSTEDKRYAEIGVEQGACFSRVRAASKVAVDPAPNFGKAVRMALGARRLLGESWAFYGATSDQFFAENRLAATPQRYSVVFVDGLHTHRQALADVENALETLAPDGYVVMHDCSPRTGAMATPAASFADAARKGRLGPTYEWCGDVWKAMVHLRSQRPDVSAFVLDADYGVGVVRRGVTRDPLRLTVEEISEMTYADLDRDRARLLGLEAPSYLSEFLTRADRAALVPLDARTAYQRR